MKKLSFLLTFLVLAVSACRVDGQQRFSLEERETIRRTLEFSQGNAAKVLEVDNLQGEIRVTGYDGRNVEMVVNKTIRAHSQEDMKAAKDRVRLDISDKVDAISIYVDHPGRQRSNRSSTRSNWSYPGYEVSFDFELRVPRQTELHLWTVTDGGIRVEGVVGDFDVSNVTGGIELSGIAGSGRAQTVNGSIDVRFAANPARSSSFKTVNGTIEVRFQRNLSADLRFKSFNGGVYTDFPVSALPTPVNAAQTRNGRFVYRNEFEGARIGNGGPMLEFDGFNGDVRILQAK